MENKRFKVLLAVVQGVIMSTASAMAGEAREGVAFLGIAGDPTAKANLAYVGNGAKPATVSAVTVRVGN